MTLIAFIAIPILAGLGNSLASFVTPVKRRIT